MNNSIFPTCGFTVIQGTKVEKCDGALLPLFMGDNYKHGNRVYWKCSKCGRQIG